MARVPKIKIELEVVETEELKKAIAAELDKVNKTAKADIDKAIDNIFKKYVKDKVDEED